MNNNNNIDLLNKIKKMNNNNIIDLLNIIIKINNNNIDLFHIIIKNEQ